MKFAIQKLAVACAIPTSLLVGSVTRLSAQDGATNSATTGIQFVQVRAADAPPKLIPGATRKKSTPQTSGNQAAARTRVQRPVSQATEGINATRIQDSGIRQVVNQSPQRPPQNSAGESDVQRQLRALYEKSGQEMPVMDLDELEVPEPQPGVMPQGGPPPAMQQSATPPGMMTPTQEPAKKPSFFERVFLGKKAPAPQPQPNLNRPQGQGAGTPRPPTGQSGAVPQTGVPRGAQPGTPGYRPFTANGQPQTGAPAQNGVPGQYGVPGQRPGMNQPAGIPQQKQQRGVPQAAPQAGQVNQPQAQNGQPQGTPQQERKSDIPVLDDEPEESLEIDLSPRAPATNPTGARGPGPNNNQGGPLTNQQPAGRQPPVLRSDASRVVPAPLPAPVNTPVAAPSASESSDTPTATEVEENPFSGLKLILPEMPPQASNPPSTGSRATGPRSNGAQFAPQDLDIPQLSVPSDSDASPRETGNTGARTSPRTGATPFDAIPPTEVPSGQPRRAGTRTVPALPVSRQAQSGDRELSNPFLEPPASELAPLSLIEENLKKLAESPEKGGFKGFCPVMLRQHRTLAAARPQFNAQYQGKKFRFSSAAAKAEFERAPYLFAPAHEGVDGIAMLDDKKSVEGSLDNAAWYRGRLYMFSNRVNLELFNAEPEFYEDTEATEAGEVPLKTGTNSRGPVAAAPPIARPSTTAPRTTPRAASSGVAVKSTVKVNPIKVNTVSAKPAATQAATPKLNSAPSSSNQPLSNQSAGQVAPPRTASQAAPFEDELPVLSDDFDAAEPIEPNDVLDVKTQAAPPQSNTTMKAGTTVPTTPMPGPTLPDANLNGLKLKVPAGKIAPKSSSAPAPRSAAKETSPREIAPPNAGPQLNGPQLNSPTKEGRELEGPKLQGPNLNAYVAPIKPASGVSTQEANPAPRLIKPVGKRPK